MSHADVTSIVQNAGSGNYFVADIALATGSSFTGPYGGWTMVIVYSDSTEKTRRINVWDGFNFFGFGTNDNFTVTGLLTPSTGAFETHAGYFAFDGEANLNGDFVSINGTALANGLNPNNNTLNGTISEFGVDVGGRNPNFGYSWGIDTDVFDASGTVPNNATNLNVVLGSSSEGLWGGVFVVSNEIAFPAVASKTFTSSTVSVGDESTVSIVVDNPANGVNLTNFTLTDNFPANMIIAPTPDASSSCGGIVLAVPGNSNFSVSGANIPAGTSCTFTFDVITTTDGTFLNTISPSDITNAQNIPLQGESSGTLTVLPLTDSDNDGIADKDDLDNDNDGIPDTDELNTIVSNSQPACGGDTSLDFSAAATLISGTALQQGAVYRIPAVTTGTDALVTIVQTVNATVANVDNNSSDAAAFRPQTAFNLTNPGDRGYIEYNIEFVTAGGSTPVVINKFFMNLNDIDGNANYAEQLWTDNPTSYTISNPTELTMSTDGSWVIGTAGTTEYTGAGNGNPEVNYGVSYTSKSSMSIRVGGEARVAGASASGRQHNIEFSCLTNYNNPENYGIDLDSDGVANHLDLDSDNDGIYDAVEAGHNAAHLNGVVISVFGANGLANDVETSPESGTINYTIVDTDGNAPPNYLDTDSDDDGCSDANEAYANTNADGGDNEYYDSGDPPVTDANGRVASATYPVPADSGSNGTQDYVEDTIPVISTQPVDITICPGCSTVFTVVASNADSYQWQLFNGSSWVDLTNSGIHSGTTTDTLVITNASPADNGNQYRVLISSDDYVCGSTISDTAILTIQVNTVITNRRITYRVNKN
ncbi:immunoglobulin domain-containing protein [Maribacter halichondriae]|uniref:immunoglobulin domain-containing protein n=1 Tax=Maribacter halichondriae TaxID=2980554 RepID=UPI002358F877|nr:immunoglobulin domain-containing protein [Maribacter sp. Hal144]